MSNHLSRRRCPSALTFELNSPSRVRLKGPSIVTIAFFDIDSMETLEVGCLLSTRGDDVVECARVGGATLLFARRQASISKCGEPRVPPCPGR